jgi:hypothetical protein
VKDFPKKAKTGKSPGMVRSILIAVIISASDA